jgi:hypothetical protein
MTTLELTKLTPREEMIQIYSDFHKDAYGFRPRGINYDAMSLEDLEADFARFAEICKDNANAEAIAEAKAVEDFKESVKKTIALGAGNESTAFRWLAEAGVVDSGWDMDFYLWKLGISTYSPAGKVIHDKLLPYWRKALQKQAA